MKIKYVIIAGRFLSQQYAYRTKVQYVSLQSDGIMLYFGERKGLYQIFLPYYQLETIVTEDRKYVHFIWDADDGKPAGASPA